jgi:hypothetical protein
MSRHIFRATALRRYNDRLDKIVLPRYASPPWPAVLGALGGLLLVLTVLLWSAQMPIYAAGPGVVIAAPAGFDDADEVVLAAFLAPEAAARLRVEQPALVFLPGLAENGAAMEMIQPVVAVEQTPVAPAAVRARYNLDGSTGLLVAGPTVVALIRLDAPTQVALGSVGEVQIQVGTQPSLAWLPGIGRFFGIDSHAPR